MHFVFVTPRATSSSNGISTLHRMARDVAARGHRVELQIVAMNYERWTADLRPGRDTDRAPGCELPFATEDSVTPETVVVYPETVEGNLLHASRVVRYLGNREGILSRKPMGASESDFILAHSRILHPAPHAVLYSADLAPCFNAEGTLITGERVLDCTYVGKGTLYGTCDVPKGTLYIDRLWPAGQEQLAILLRQTRLFFTWDSWSQINVEALACGCIPVFLRDAPYTAAELDSAECGALPRADGGAAELNLEQFEIARIAHLERFRAVGATWDAQLDLALEKIADHFVAA